MAILKPEITAAERRKYVLSDKRDREILRMCKQFEKLQLGENGKEMVQLVKSQLEHDWRRHLLKKLHQVQKRCRKIKILSH